MTRSDALTMLEVFLGTKNDNQSIEEDAVQLLDFIEAIGMLPPTVTIIEQDEEFSNITDRWSYNKREPEIKRGSSK